MASGGHDVLDKCLSIFRLAIVQSIFLVILLSLVPLLQPAREIILLSQAWNGKGGPQITSLPLNS